MSDRQPQPLQVRGVAEQAEATTQGWEGEQPESQPWAFAPLRRDGLDEDDAGDSPRPVATASTAAEQPHAATRTSTRDEHG